MDGTLPLSEPHNRQAANGMVPDLPPEVTAAVDEEPPTSEVLLEQLRRFDDGGSSSSALLPAWRKVAKVKWSGMNLTSLPAAVGHLSALEELSTANNALTSLPPAIGRLAALKTLGIYANRLPSLPDSIGDLGALEELLASKNPLTSLPHSIGRLRALKTLRIFECQLSSLPDSIGELRALELLVVSKNRLSRLPDSLDQCESLRVLRASANRLVTLRPSVPSLPSLTELALSDNPLQQPPFAVAVQGLPAVRRYFAELARGASVTSRWAKFVLLGSGEGGKTSLLRALQRGRPDPTGGEEDRTVQLSLTVLALPMHDESSGEEGAYGEAPLHAMLSCWDVGGQPDYAALQQPYITNGPLFGLAVRLPYTGAVPSEGVVENAM